MIIPFCVIGLSLTFMGFTLNKVEKLKKEAELANNYPKALGYHKLSAMLAISIITIASVVALLLVNYSYNFYNN
jgi:hypothetical protein